MLGTLLESEVVPNGLSARHTQKTFLMSGPFFSDSQPLLYI